ncbi:hypothetical protein PFISCL1PPCAC_24893, partial [Pristionchus fissidentatus]
QELARKSTITTPTNDSAQFRERIFAGTDIVRVDRDINFVCDRPILALSERREYIPEYPAAPPRRRSSIATKTPRVSLTPSALRSRSQSRSWTDSEKCPTAQEDLPTATSPYSLFEDHTPVSPCGSTRTACGASPISDRNSRSKRKKWTVNSVVAKAGAATPERYDRARTMRSLSTARNLSISPPALNRNIDMKTARDRTPNGETVAIRPVLIQPKTELGPHGECQLVEGMEVLKVAAPVDSLIRTCHDGSPRRSASDCSTAGEMSFRTPCSENNNACESPPFSPPRTMPRTNESSSRASTPLRTARNQSPICQQRQCEPSSAALDRRRSMFGYGTRPTTTPTTTRSAINTPSGRSPMIEGNMYTGLEASPMRIATRVVLSPVHTAVRSSSKKSQKKNQGSVAKCLAPPDNYRTSSYSPHMNTAVPPGTPRNLFGSLSPNEPLANAFVPQRDRSSAIRTAREARTPSRVCENPPPYFADVRTARELNLSPYRPARSPALEPMTARSPAHSLQTGRFNSPLAQYPIDMITAEERSPAMNTARPPARSPYGGSHYRLGALSILPTARHLSDGSPDIKTASGAPYDNEMCSPGGLVTARNQSDRSPMMKTARFSPYDNVKTAREAANRKSPCDADRCPKTARQLTDRSPMMKTAKYSPYDNVKTCRETRSPARGGPPLFGDVLNAPPAYDNVKITREQRSPARGLPTARQNTDRSPMIKTARYSPYDNTKTARETRTPALKTANGSPYAPRSLYLAPEMVALNNVHTAVEGGGGQSPAPRASLYLTPEMIDTNVRTGRGTSPYNDGVCTGVARSPSSHCNNNYDGCVWTGRPSTGEYKRIVTARVVSPTPRDLTTSPLHPTMTARDVTSGRSPMRTARRDGDYDAVPNSTMTCLSGRSSNQNTTRSHMVYTSRAPSASPLRTARMDGGPPTTPRPDVMTHLPSLRSLHTPRAFSPDQRTAIGRGEGPEIDYATNRTQSPSVYSSASGRMPSKSPSRSSNVITAQGSRSPHVGTESPTNMATARGEMPKNKALSAPQSPLSMRTGRERSRGATASPCNLATAREQRTPSKSPASSTRLSRELQNTMPAHLKQEDSFSEQSQFTYHKTLNGGFAQKNTHSDLMTGQQRTPTKCPNTQSDPTLYYSSRQTTPARTLRPDDQRTPTRGFSQHTGLEARSPLVRTAVHTTPLKQQNEMPACSLKSGCKATHEPRKIPSVAEDSPSTRSDVAPKTPERSLRTARGLSLTRPMTPRAPYADMRTPRTANPTASPASSLLQSPVPSSCVRTAMSPDAASNSAVSNDVNTARRVLSDPSRSSVPPLTRSNWMQSDNAAEPTTTTKPRVIVRANQADGKIHVEVCLSFKLNTTGTIRLRGEMVPQLHPRTVSVNGQQIWSDPNRQ